MTRPSFKALLRKKWREKRFVCVGLDSQYDRIPKHLKNGAGIADSVFSFNKEIVDATCDLVCAYKPQYAFYGALAEPGIKALRKTVNYIHQQYPDIAVILDAKRNDIGNTAQQYVTEVFGVYQVDAVTINPYLGSDGINPFLNEKDKGVIILCRTSNPSAKEFQDWIVDHPELGKVPLYQVVAYQVAKKWNSNDNCCLVVGATYPEESALIRKIAPDLPFLIPGIGKQGGNVQKTVTASKDSDNMGMIINSSRGIIFASEGKDFAQAARNTTISLSDQIKKCL